MLSVLLVECVKSCCRRPQAWPYLCLRGLWKLLGKFHGVLNAGEEIVLYCACACTCSQRDSDHRATARPLVLALLVLPSTTDRTALPTAPGPPSLQLLRPVTPMAAMEGDEDFYVRY